MGKGVLEWPAPDVHERKYKGSWTVFDTPSGAQLIWVHGIQGLNNHLDIAGAQIEGLPIYYSFESGYYSNEYKDPFPCVYFLARRFRSEKIYKVGICNDGWSLMRIPIPKGNKSQVTVDQRIKLDVLNPPSRLEGEHGVIDRRYLIHDDRVYHKENLIGMKTGKRLMIDHPAFKEDLRRYLDNSWEVC